jgi:hypothetical protein
VGFLNQTFLVGVDDRTTNPALVLSGLARDHWSIRLLGVLWLLLAIGFFAAGVGVLQGAEWVVPVLWAVTIPSTLLSIMWVREAPFGLVANLIVLAVLIVPALHDRILP